jgi:hypothetical protein
MRELGVKEKVVPNSTIFAEPFLEAISALKEVPKCQTAHEKFQKLVLTNQVCFLLLITNKSKQLVDSLNSGKQDSVGADELLPIYFYVFIKANLPHVYSEYQFMCDFVDDAVQNSEWGYRYILFFFYNNRFSNFENAVQYVHMLDVNIRDETNVLVPTLVLEDRLCDACEQCMKESKKEKAAQAPRLLWLSSVFLVIGNQSSQFTNATERVFQIQNRTHINMMNIYYEYARRIVSSVGLKLQRKPKDLFEEEDTEESEQWTDVEPRRWRSPASDDEYGIFSDAWSYSIEFEQLYPSYVYYRLASKIEEVIDQKEGGS